MTTCRLNLPPHLTHNFPAQLAQIAQERILILDGAMGTMIQAYQFSESDYRGRTVCRLAL